MADLSKLKKRLGMPPAMSETTEVLSAPETAPAAPEPIEAPEPRPAARQRHEDGRSARRTGRTLQFATRVSAEFDRKFRSVAKRDKLLMAALLEKALDAYENSRA